MYAEIVDNEVVKIHDHLPVTYGNVSNFFAVDVDLLYDLIWCGLPNTKFYIYVPPEPPPENYAVESVSYVIDDDNKRVYGTNAVVPLGPPESVTATQIRLWLIQNNISLAQISAVIANIEDPLLRDKTSIQWEYAPYIERNHPLVESIGVILGLNSAQIDNAFIEASKL
jgi:hypothetical protein